MKSIKTVTLVIITSILMVISFQRGKYIERTSIQKRYDKMHPSKTEVEGYARTYVFKGDSLNIYMHETGNYPKGIRGTDMIPYFKYYKDRL